MLPGVGSVELGSPGGLGRPRESSSNSDRPHPAEIPAYGMPYPCLLGYGAKFPVIQENLPHWILSDCDTNPHSS